MTLIDQLLTLSSAYCAAVGVSEPRLATRAFGSGRSLERLREGKDILTRNAERGVQWFSDNWPDLTAAWPESVPRPDPLPGSAAHERSSAPAPAAA